jgi:D-3-phosphoglycerate dehydrogenase / 2-oxoglutarate reductase
MRALLVENIHLDAVSLLDKAGFEVECLDRAPSEDELCQRLDGVQVLGIRSQSQVSERVLESANALRAVGAFCIGTNQIDLPAAARKGIAVFNAPYSNTRSVVELALAEMISLTRNLTKKNHAMHSGVWDKSASGSHEIRGRRLGIVGYGNIGSQLSVIAESLGMSVFFYDVTDKLALGNARSCGTLAELLEAVDIVTLHVDGRSENSDFFGDEHFARMRPGSIFLNLSRGFVVDHAALRDRLRSGHLAGAAIDVFPAEPKSAADPFLSELQGLDNVILTPHIGGSTEEAQQDIGNFVGTKLVRYLASGATPMCVNLPTLDLPATPDAFRLLYIHHNVPGVLAEVNSLVADHGMNIEAQLLGTRDQTGYVITDVAAEPPADLLLALERLDATVRLRLVRPTAGEVANS